YCCGLGSRITCRHPFIHHVPFADSGAAGDPFIRSLNNLLEIGIGHHPGGNISSQGGDLGTPRLAHSIRFSVMKCETLLYAPQTESPILTSSRIEELELMKLPSLYSHAVKSFNPLQRQ